MTKEDMENECIDSIKQIFSAYKSQGKRVTIENIRNMHLTLFETILHLETIWLKEITKGPLK